MRRNIVPAVVLVGVLALQTGPRLAQAQSPYGVRQAEQPPATPCAPALAASSAPAGLGQAKPEEADRTLPINLATALRLADARPLIIEAARAAVETEYGFTSKPAFYVAAERLAASARDDYHATTTAANRTCWTGHRRSWAANKLARRLRSPGGLRPD